MICAQAIVQFRPHESYEKYLKLLVGVMVLIQLFLPLGRIFLGGDRVDTVLQLESIRESLEQGMKAAEQYARETDALLEQMTLEEVRRRMEEQAALSGEDTDGTANGTGSVSTPGGPVTVEVEPVQPILGE